MAKKKRQQPQSPKASKKMSLITLGKPEPILTTVTDYEKIWYNNSAEYYTYPIERLALAQAPNLNAQHGGIIYARHNMTCRDYLNGGLSHQQMKEAIFNYLVFGDVAILKVRNGWGDVLDLVPLPSLFLHRKKDGKFVIGQEVEDLVYSPDEIKFIKQYDPQQQIYGLPDYLGGLHAALLNSEATIFRRRYYHNGAHTGGMLYCNDKSMTDEVEANIVRNLEQSKGIGNFSTMFVHIPGGDPEAIKFIPVGDISAKDEFSSIKTISAQDILNAHRFPAGLSGIVPTDGSILGDPIKARQAYKEDEIIPIQKLFMDEINNDPDIPEHLHIHFDINNTLPE